MSNAANLSAKTEPLTDSMIKALRDEADARADYGAVWACDWALDGREDAKDEVCRIINSARAMDDDRPFVRVVP